MGSARGGDGGSSGVGSGTSSGSGGDSFATRRRTDQRRVGETSSGGVDVEILDGEIVQELRRHVSVAESLHHLDLVLDVKGWVREVKVVGEVEDFDFHGGGGGGGGAHRGNDGKGGDGKGDAKCEHILFFGGGS